MSPLYLPWCVDASLFLQWYPSTATPGFDPGTFGSQARLPNHAATAVVLFSPLKLRVFLTCFVFCCVYFPPSPDRFILCAQKDLQYDIDILHVCRSYLEKLFDVFGFLIFGQAQCPCPYNFFWLSLSLSFPSFIHRDHLFLVYYLQIMAEGVSLILLAVGLFICLASWSVLGWWQPF